jgi:hypothetical protein
MDTSYVSDPAHRALDPRQHHAELPSQVVRKVARFAVVSARLQEQDHRQPGGLVRGA